MKQMRAYQIVTLFAVASLLVPGLARGDSLADRVPELVEEKSPRIIEHRHHIHRHPELSNRETETAALVAEHLRGLGIEVETGIAHTGVVGLLQGGRPGPTVAVRADMDALPVTERSELPFASTKTTTYRGEKVGVAHACGHDIHTAVGLGTASVLAAMRDELPGTVLFVFQPAEEGPPPGEEGGAELMLEEGVFEERRPEAIFALHSWPSFEVGEVGVAAGPTMAAVDRFEITIEGEQAHGAYPHLGIDPIVMASQAINALQTIRSRNLDPLAPSVVTVGIVRGGERFNIIPQQVELVGTVRSYGGEVQDTIERRMSEILDGITSAGGGSYTIDYERVTPATVNDAELHRLVKRTLTEALGDEHVHETEPTMGGEDFAYFANVVPGYYFRLGTREPGGTSGGLHTPTFRAVDGAVPVGMRAMSRIVVDYLAAQGAGR